MQKRREGSPFGRHKTKRNQVHAAHQQENRQAYNTHLLTLLQGFVSERGRMMPLPNGRRTLAERNAHFPAHRTVTGYRAAKHVRF